MDTKEFKVWFEGFCDSIDGAPTAEQFAKIKAKVQGLSEHKYTGIRGAGLPTEPRWQVGPDTRMPFRQEPRPGDDIPF